MLKWKTMINCKTVLNCKIMLNYIKWNYKITIS